MHGIVLTAVVCLEDGLTVPARAPHEPSCPCNFTSGSGKRIMAEMLPEAQHVGFVAFEVGRRIVQKADKARKVKTGCSSQQLTSRQRDCLVLAAKGKSDTDIAQLLGISSRTVHHHIEVAKGHFGMSTRIQLVVYTLSVGLLAFDEVLT